MKCSATWRVRHLGKLRNGSGFPIDLQGVPDQEIGFFKVKHLNRFGLGNFLTETEDTVSAQTARSLRANIFPSGTIVFAKIGAALLLNRISMLGREGCIDNNMAAFISNDKLIIPSFALLALSQIDMRLMVHPGAVPSLDTEAFNNFRVFLPGIDIQNEVVDFLYRETTHINKLILKKQRLVELLDEKIQSQNTNLVIRGLDPLAHFQDSEVEWIPAIPAHWRVFRIANLFHESQEMGEAGLPVLSVSINWGISDRELSDEDRHRVVNQIEDKTAYKRVRPGDLVYNMMRAWQGAFGVATVDGLVSPAYVVARPKEIIYSPYFETLLRTPMCVEEFRRASKGIADFRQRLYWDNFRQVRVALPPITEQRAIADEVQKIKASIERVKVPVLLSIERLHEFRLALITAAVTGRIDVRTWRRRGNTDRRLDELEEQVPVKEARA